MILPKTSITDVDLDEFERQLREFEFFTFEIVYSRRERTPSG